MIPNSLTDLQSMLSYNTRELPMWTVSSIKESIAHPPQRSLHWCRWAIEVSSSSNITPGSATTPWPIWPDILTSYRARDTSLIMQHHQSDTQPTWQALNRAVAVFLSSKRSAHFDLHTVLGASSIAHWLHGTYSIGRAYAYPTPSKRNNT